MDHQWVRLRQGALKTLSVLAVLALGVLWTGAPSLAQENETMEYAVQPGDTLYRLSQRFGTTVDRLVELNDIEDPDLIYVNQVLRVPAGNVPAGETAPPTPTPTPASRAPAGGPLSFTWERVGWRYEGANYISVLRIEASGGQPPYTYFHDGIAQETTNATSFTIEVPSRRGNPKPGSVGVQDATGNYIKTDYWLMDPCDYPPGVEITRPKEDADLKSFPRRFNVEWETTVDPAPDGYYIEIEAWQDGDWRSFKTYRYDKGDSTLFYVPDPFPGDLGGRVRMWGYYGRCEASYKTPWRYFEFRVTY
jgi:LysM repeat protein